MNFLILLFSFSRLFAADFFDEKEINCKAVTEQIQKMDQIIPEREAKGLDVSEWYKKRNQYLSENKNCKQLKNINPLEPKNNKTIIAGSKSSMATCTPIDLRKKLGPVRDQGKTGWCFAYTASDLLTAKIGKEVSAVGVAISFKTDSIFSFFDKIKGNSAFRTGVISSAIRASQKDICLESELPSNLSGFDIEKAFINITENKVSNSDCLTLKGVLPIKEISNFVKIANKLSDRDFLKEIAKTSCKSKNQHNYVAEEIEKSKLITGIDNVLNQGQIIGIGFDPRFWEEGTQYIGKKFDHAASVVGRKWDTKTNTCRYMIRDSQGSNCSIYDKVYECEKGGGYTWVPEATLINNIDSAYFLK